VPEKITFAVPEEVELVPDPIRPNWIIEGTPQARSKRLAQSADGTSMIMAWSCSAGRFHWHYAVDETLHITTGEVFVTDDDGKVRRLLPGDMAFFPAGSSSTLVCAALRAQARRMPSRDAAAVRHPVARLEPGDRCHHRLFRRAGETGAAAVGRQ
jgi:uncharacterized cupin superfamily protein